MKNNENDKNFVEIILSAPQGKKPSRLTKEDVWGKWDELSSTKISNGMIVASYNEVCPAFKDVVPYKSVTVVCDEDQVDDVTYWLEYVHGAECVEKTKRLDDGKVAIRSNYQCW